MLETWSQKSASNKIDESIRGIEGTVRSTRQAAKICV